MAQIRTIPPVKYFFGFIYQGSVSFNEIQSPLEDSYGPFDFLSDEVPFDYTRYYEDEMGPGLIRRYGSLKNLMDPADLPSVKISSNGLEERFAVRKGENIFRTVNLDPGYIEEGKLILATTKNHKHRVYIAKGIYGEVTMYWSKGRFHPYPHTYPDYQSNEAMEFFIKVREEYRRQLYS